MKKTTKRVLVGVGVVVGVGVAVASMLRGDDGDSEAETVAVARGTVTDMALAVGHIEPEVEVDVKSQVSSVVGRRYSDEGEYVEQGTPLLEVRPNPIPKELVEARRDVKMNRKDVPYHQNKYQRLKRLPGARDCERRGLRTGRGAARAQALRDSESVDGP